MARHAEQPGAAAAHLRAEFDACDGRRGHGARAGVGNVAGIPSNSCGAAAAAGRRASSSQEPPPPRRARAAPRRPRGGAAQLAARAPRREERAPRLAAKCRVEPRRLQASRSRNYHSGPPLRPQPRSRRRSSLRTSAMESPAALRNSADGYNHAVVLHDDLDAEGEEVERDEVAYFRHACTTEFYAARDAGPEQLRCTHCDGDFVERLPEGAATFASSPAKVPAYAWRLSGRLMSGRPCSRGATECRCPTSAGMPSEKYRPNGRCPTRGPGSSAATQTRSRRRRRRRRRRQTARWGCREPRFSYSTFWTNRRRFPGG